MKKIATTLALTTALALPALAQAKPLTLIAQMKRYSGNGAYLVMYVTDSKGAYKDTLWMAGGKSKYYKHLSDWARASGKRLSEVNGITGASTGSGSTFVVTVDLADALLDAGYELHIDASVEDKRDSPSEIVVPLTSANAGKPVKGRRYIKSFSYK